jgi:2-phosphoglycerate kinase
VGFTQAHLIADQLFDQLADQHQHSPDTPEITLHTDWIKWIAQAILSNRTRNVPTRINIAQLVRAKEFPIIILVAGTSGSGKSSVAARLSERLSILSLLSTDSIREQLRTIQSFNEQEYPALHVSTYETHKVVGEELKSESKLLCGYKRQCDIVMKSIPHILQKRMNSKIPTIVEGVHLSAEHIKEIIEKCPNSLIFSFCIYVSEQVNIWLADYFKIFNLSRMYTKKGLQAALKEGILTQSKTNTLKILEIYERFKIFC